MLGTILMAEMFFLKKWANPGLFLFIFGLFKKNYKFLQQIYVKECPSSIWCRDSNPRPLERESPPITIRPGLQLLKCLLVNWLNFTEGHTVWIVIN